ncbi:hypothetical protein ACQ4PT_005989 [Festuca glaucescens]
MDNPPAAAVANNVVNPPPPPAAANREANPPAADVAAAAVNIVVNIPAAPARASSATGESSAMIEKDIELGRLNANTTLAQGPQHYFQEVCEFGVLLNNMANMVRKLKEANQEFNSVIELAAMKEIKGRMENDMDEVVKMAHEIKEKFKKMTINYMILLVYPVFVTTLNLVRETVTGINLSDQVIRVIDIGNVVQMFESALQGISAEQMVAAVYEIKERHTATTDFGKKILEVQQVQRADNDLPFLVVVIGLGLFLFMLSIILISSG